MMQENKIEKTIVVLGTQKSGTSMTAGLLHLLGVNMGEKLRTADSQNPKGYFEDIEFLKLNSEICKTAHGHPWINPPSQESILSQKEKFDGEIKKIIEKKNSKFKLWGWKGGGLLTLTIELFLPYLRNPYLVVIFRNPLGTANSMVAHTGGNVDFSRALKLTNFYNKELLKVLEKYPALPKIFISFEGIIANPSKEANRLAKFLNLPLTEEKINQIKQFVIPRNRIEREKRKAGFIFQLSRTLRVIKRCLLDPKKFSYYFRVIFKK